MTLIAVGLPTSVAGGIGIVVIVSPVGVPFLGCRIGVRAFGVEGCCWGSSWFLGWGCLLGFREVAFSLLPPLKRYH